MTWYCAKTFGPDVRALFHLQRAGLRTFSPEIHRYFKDRRTQRECKKPCILRLFPGYAFVWIENAIDRDKCVSATGVAYMLGSWTEDTFQPIPMPPEWIDGLMKAGPKIEGKKIRFTKGQRVRYAAGLAQLIAEVETDMRSHLDESGKIAICMEMFGKRHTVTVDADKLEPVAD